MNIKTIFTYPLEDKDWAVKIVIGIALSVLPVINFFCLGYGYRIFTDALEGKATSLPEWDGWKELFVTGFFIFLILFCYYLIPLLMTGTGSVLLVWCLVLRYRGDTIPPEAALVGIVLLSVGLILMLIVWAIFPMALAVWTKNKRRFFSAFKLWEIVPNIFRTIDEYIVSLAITIGVFFAFFILCIIPYFGILFMLIFGFYLKYLFYYALWGKACRNAFIKETVTEVKPEV